MRTRSVQVEELTGEHYTVTVYASGTWVSGLHTVTTVCKLNGREEHKNFIGANARTRAIAYAKDSLRLREECSDICRAQAASDTPEKSSTRSRKVTIVEAASRLLAEIGDDSRIKAVGTDNDQTITVYLRQKFDFDISRYRGYKVQTQFSGEIKSL